MIGQTISHYASSKKSVAAGWTQALGLVRRQLACRLAPS